MPASNVAQLGIGLQSAKGTRSTAPLFWLNLTGGRIRLAPETEQRSETGLGRDVGATYIRVLAGNGDPSFLLRPKTAPLLYYLLYGAKAAANVGTLWLTGQTYTLGQIIRTSANKVFEVTTAGTGGTVEPTATTIGSTVNATGGVAVYTLRSNTALTQHTITPANDQPWCTVWFRMGDTLYEVLQDAKFTGGNLEWAPGGDLALSCSIVGLGMERLTSDPGGGTQDLDEPFRVPGAVYTIGASPDNTLTSGNFNVEANQTPIQTNDIVYSYLEAGTRAISFGYEGVWTSVARYAQVYYGGAAGTIPAKTLFTTDVAFQFGTPGYGPLCKFEIQKAIFTEAGTDPNPDGSPMMISVAGAADRPAAGQISQATFINDVASYAAA
jgi:hypothetical protein